MYFGYIGSFPGDSINNNFNTMLRYKTQISLFNVILLMCDMYYTRNKTLKYFIWYQLNM